MSMLQELPGLLLQAEAGTNNFLLNQYRRAPVAGMTLRQMGASPLGGSPSFMPNPKGGPGGYQPPFAPFVPQQRGTSDMLLRMGLGILAANQPRGGVSPSFAGAVGSGALAGLDSYNRARLADSRIAANTFGMQNNQALQQLRMRELQARLAKQARQREAVEAFVSEQPASAQALARAYPERFASAQAGSMFRPETKGSLQRDIEYMRTLDPGSEERILARESIEGRGGGPTINIGQQYPSAPQGMVRVPDPGSETGTRLVAEPGAPVKPPSTEQGKVFALSESIVSATQELENAFTNPDGSVNTWAVMQSKIPGTALNSLMTELITNSTFLKSCASAGESERAAIGASIEPGAIDTLLGSDPLSGLRRMRDFANQRSREHSQQDVIEATGDAYDRRSTVEEDEIEEVGRMTSGQRRRASRAARQAPATPPGMTPERASKFKIRRIQ